MMKTHNLVSPEAASFVPLTNNNSAGLKPSRPLSESLFIGAPTERPSRKIKPMKIKSFACAAAVAALCSINTFASLPVGPGFTYQGRLNDGGVPANGNYDLGFVLHDDPNTLNYLGNSIIIPAVPVTNGLFAVELNANGEFGPNAFNGQARWLEVDVRTNNNVLTNNFIVLTPRQPLTLAPHAMFALNASNAMNASFAATVADGSISSSKLAPGAVQSGNLAPGAIAWSSIVGIPAGFADGIDNGTNYAAGPGLTLSGANNQFSVNFAGSGSASAAAHSDHNHFGSIWSGNALNLNGLSISNTAVNGAGLFGQQGTGSGFPYIFGNTAGIWGESSQGSGVHGATAYTNGSGVLGLGVATSGANRGVSGTTLSTTGTGVYGNASATSGANFGVQGVTASAQGIGVSGLAQAATGINYGVFGKTASTNGAGVYGLGRNIVTNSFRNFYASTGGGVFGESSASFGVAGASDAADGVHGISHAGYGVSGESLAVSGVYGQSQYGSGVFGYSPGGFLGGGTSGYSEDGFGVSGSSINNYGVIGSSSTGVPLYAELDSSSLYLSIIEGWQYDGANLVRRFRVTGGGDVFASGAFHPNGADFAEMLPAQDALEPGDVLVINENGKLAKSTAPNQANVAGVHATKPGLLGGAQDGADLAGKVPLAVVGVVPVKVTAENGPIKPGDKLTTSSTPGHAMKADKHSEIGTVIGKALTALDGKQGVIQMLVILQ
jgi:hypothetical protein